jgi:DnaK suppressor protein
MLTNEEREKLLTIIEREIISSKQDIEELKELIKPVSLDASIGRISRMDAINNKSINEDALRKTRRRLQKLEKVQELARNSPESLGKCIRCGGRIPFGRLEFMPESRVCVQCAGRR